MVDDGLVIDLSRMKGIFVDPAKGTATTGIAGLTLGGGVGWLMGKCGLVCDNTLSYEVAVANGELIRATADENADLFWALKEGGGNFGVVTSITYRMYPINTVISGTVLRYRDILYV
jgi:FAD/FMN-containing dehydrogenase